MNDLPENLIIIEAYRKMSRNRMLDIFSDRLRIYKDMHYSRYSSMLMSDTRAAIIYMRVVGKSKHLTKFGR